MILSWKEFAIDLRSFKSWLDINIPSSDGLVCSEEECVVVEKTPFSSDDISTVITYYNSLDEVTEADKLNRMTILNNKYLAIREAAISKDWDDMSMLERKIVAAAPLVDEDLATLAGM